MRHALLALAALTLVGCDQSFAYSGFQMTDFFPLDGDVVGWTFGNQDDAVDYWLIRTITEEEGVNPETREDSLVVWTWRVEARCADDATECSATGWQYDLQMSADNRRGVLIHGYDTPDSGAVAFDPPLRLAPARMAHGDVTTSEGVDGHTFTSTFVGNEGCDQTIAVNWECAHLQVVSEPEGHWLAGDYWATAGYNVVAFQRTGDPGKWVTIRNPVTSLQD